MIKYHVKDVNRKGTNNDWQVQVFSDGSFRIWGHYYNTQFDRVFAPGDEVSVGQYNFIYTGRIVKATEKTVLVTEDLSGENKRFKWYNFIWRNYDFDSARAHARNLDTLQHI